MDPLKMYFLLKIMIFHCYVSLPEGIPICLKVLALGSPLPNESRFPGFQCGQLLIVPGSSIIYMLNYPPEN